jgi:uncharacterized repeat protein (TIGR02543 family)
MDGNMTVTANFVHTFTLSASPKPDMGGTVSPDGTRSYNAGSQVTLTAIPSANYTFTGWSGACSGTGTCILAMDGNKTVTANFIRTFTLTTSAVPPTGGAVSPPGTNTHFSGISVTITATPAGGYAFSHWTGSCSGDGPCTVLIGADLTVVANFVQTFSLTTSAEPSPGGTVTPSGTSTHYSGVSLTLKAVASDNYAFAEWSGDCAGTGTCLLTMDANKTVTANFVQTFRLTTSVEPSIGGIVSPSGTTTYTSGFSVTVTATPAAGYAFSGWSDACTGTISCVVTMDANKTVTANFRESGNDPSTRLFVMNADGSMQSRLPTPIPNLYSPDWSPDGTQILFIDGWGNGFDIYKMNSDGSNPTAVAGRYTNGARDPAWSPDGTKIAFVSQRNGQDEIYVMNADGSDQTRLTHHTATQTY